MKIFQQQLSISKRRGYHLITNDVIKTIPQLREINAGMCQVFMQHTSAALTINENAAPAVRVDFAMYFDKIAPENDPQYTHDDEGPDDMPAHLKTAILGTSVLIPISNGRLALGTWQGIYFCEHRDRGGLRNMMITIWGE